MSQARKPQEGKVIVRLAENPMQLRGWTIIDNRGNQVDVALADDADRPAAGRLAVQVRQWALTTPLRCGVRPTDAL